MGGSEESSQSIHKERCIIVGGIMLKQITNIRLKAIRNNEWITANKRWIFFAICCISFILVAIQDANMMTNWFLSVIVMLVEDSDSSGNLEPIPTLIMAL